ncbi:MAG: haloacid dehalogenase [Syntrophobacteraceae bacterium]
MIKRASIEPEELAFDIDGVVADTMAVFLDLARERYGLKDLKKEHLSCFNLYNCLDLRKEIIDDLLCLTLDDAHTMLIPPMPGAVDVLTELSAETPLRFVTARIWPEAIIEWLQLTLPEVPSDRIHVIATGSPEAKLEILKGLNVRYFVEDRIETCELLLEDGFQPLLFDQPWNRGTMVGDVPRIENWAQLREWVLPMNGKYSNL